MTTTEQTSQMTKRHVFRHLRRRYLHLVAETNHDDIVANVREEGRFSPRYAFMIAMSCAIATLGLLLSSPAVIIGAMLISPLMGPIVKLGFSLTIIDLKALRSALFAVFLGLFLSLAMSFVIVKISPLTQVTSEILARTQPNLFDLLVAVFSGLAGAYSTINSRGATIVGVAIATALMPPLAVVGFGLATGSMAIAYGAGFLFMTNLLAISLSVTCVALFYGFGARHSPRHTVWQSALVLGVFSALSVPLGIALRDIAYEAYVASAARETVQAYYQETENRLSDFRISITGTAVKVDAMVLTKSYIPDAEQVLRDSLQQTIGRPVVMNVDQVLVDQSASLDPTEFLKLAETKLAAPLQSQISQLRRRDQLGADLRNAASFKVAALEFNQATKFARFFAAPSSYLSLAAYREMESEIAARFPDWGVEVAPPTSGLPPLFFERGEETVSAKAADDLSTIIWALSRWTVDQVVVVGFASTEGEQRRFNNESLAVRRANAVGTVLAEAGIRSTVASQYRTAAQQNDERTLGVRSFQRVEIRIPPTSEEAAAMLIQDNSVSSVE